MKCVIPCAGKGTRLGSELPKALVPINGKPLLQYVWEMWDGCEFIFVVGHEKEKVIEILPKGSMWVEQKELTGTAHAILQAEPYVEDKFIVALGDCLQYGCFRAVEVVGDIGIGVWKGRDIYETKKSYLVGVTRGGLVWRVVEKPEYPTPRTNCGMGSFFFSKRVFDYIRETPVGAKSEVGIVDTIQLMIEDGVQVSPVWFQGKYINVTYPDDIRTVERWKGGAKGSGIDSCVQ